MKLKENSSEQKLRGAYYTPLKLANAMVKLFVSEKINTILEPSCGDGVFIEALYQQNIISNNQEITAIEIEKEEAQKVNFNFKNQKNVNVYNEDFFEFYKRTADNIKYDLIIGNPPYIRYQYLTEAQREIQSKILTDNGMKSNKLINAWVCFLVASVQMLSENGKIAFVIPAEILQVAYAEDLRKYLADHLQRMTLITFERLVFDEIEQEVLVFVGEKGGEEKGIRIIEMEDLNGFDLLDLNSNGYQKLQHTTEKWTKYFITTEESSLINDIRDDIRFCKFSDYGLINVGITTGNNDYFSVNKETVDKYNLDSVVLPLIGRSSHARGIYFTDEDWNANISDERKAMLLAFPDIPIEQYDKRHIEYIKHGEVNGENAGYKCSIRDRWYIVPSVWVPDAFFLRRSNLYPKFVLNDCNAVSTDTMHRMKFVDGVDPDNVLLSYYNSISFAFTEICGRSYGGGVLEILPGEMGNIMLPKIEGIDSSKKSELLLRVDNIVRNNLDIETALDIVDKEVLQEIMGIEEEMCTQCRQIWKKLQKRRLGRS